MTRDTWHAVMYWPTLYILQDVYTPLHLVPPTVHGLIGAIENKYKINATNIRFLYRKNKDGIVAKVDDDMLRHYCNEDVFLMQVINSNRQEPQLGLTIKNVGNSLGIKISLTIQMKKWTQLNIFQLALNSIFFNWLWYKWPSEPKAATIVKN